MAEQGSFRERWQYRQEMKAQGAGNHWGFPTRDDFAQFRDARNLADLLKTWRPHNLAAYGLGEQGLTPLLQAEKDDSMRYWTNALRKGCRRQSTGICPVSESLAGRTAHARWGGEAETAQTPADKLLSELVGAAADGRRANTSVSRHPRSGAGLGAGARWMTIRDLRDRLDALKQLNAGSPAASGGDHGAHRSPVRGSPTAGVGGDGPGDATGDAA